MRRLINVGRAIAFEAALADLDERASAAGGETCDESRTTRRTCELDGRRVRRCSAATTISGSAAHPRVTDGLSRRRRA